MPQKRANSGKPKSTRRPGNSRPGRRPVTPEVLQKIGRMWLRGQNNCEIAKEIGVDESTVRYHLQNHIRPIWHEDMRSRLAEDLAKVALLERTAWERFESKVPCETHAQVEKALLEDGNKPRIVKQAVRKITRTGEVAWLQIVQWCLEFRARIHGHFAPTRHQVYDGSEFRVAGMTPVQVDQMMLERLMEKIAERRRRAGLESGEN